MNTDLLLPLIPPTVLAGFGLVYWATHRHQISKTDPAHKGCARLDTILYADDSEFVEVTIYVHDREQDRNPYLLVQVDDEDNVRVPYADILEMNITDNSQDPNRPMSAFGISYSDFTGDARLLFTQLGTSHGLTKTQVETIKESYDLWAAGVGKAPLVLKDEHYKKPKRSLVRRSA